MQWGREGEGVSQTFPIFIWDWIFQCIGQFSLSIVNCSFRGKNLSAGRGRGKGKNKIPKFLVGEGGGEGGWGGWGGRSNGGKRGRGREVVVVGGR